MNFQITLKFKKGALFPFNVTLPPLVVLTGLNGAGKTQLLRLINDNFENPNHSPLEIVKGNGSKFKRAIFISPLSLVMKPQENAQTSVIAQFPTAIFNSYLNILNGVGMGYPAQLNFEERLQTTDLNSIVTNVAKIRNKSIERLEVNDFKEALPIVIKENNNQLFQQDLSSLFLKYARLRELNRYRRTLGADQLLEEEKVVFSDEEFLERFGRAPWEVINDILGQLNLPFTVAYPKGVDLEGTDFCALVLDNKGDAYSFENLSSGERVIVSLAIALLNSGYESSFPDLILLDEIDASLHPSMSKDLVRVIDETFVKKLGLTVILTTHSPSTVALAAEESLFVLERGVAGVRKVSKDDALLRLLDGVPSLSIHYENRRQVFVEDGNDVIYYEKLLNIFKGKLQPEITLNFIASGDVRKNSHGGPRNSCQDVEAVVKVLRDFKNPYIYGLVDRDENKKSTEHVRVLGEGSRYAIENYLLDPLLIGVLLLREALLPAGFSGRLSYMEIPNATVEQLQSLTDYVVHKVSAKFKETLGAETEFVTLGNGMQLRFPKWFMNIQGHKWEEKVIEAFVDLKKIKNKNDEQGEKLLKVAVIDKVLNDCPFLLAPEIFQTFKRLQLLD